MFECSLVVENQRNQKPACSVTRVPTLCRTPQRLTNLALTLYFIYTFLISYGFEKVRLAVSRQNWSPSSYMHGLITGSQVGIVLTLYAGSNQQRRKCSFSQDRESLSHWVKPMQKEYCDFCAAKYDIYGANTCIRHMCLCYIFYYYYLRCSYILHHM